MKCGVWGRDGAVSEGMHLDMSLLTPIHYDFTLRLAFVLISVALQS